MSRTLPVVDRQITPLNAKMTRRNIMSDEIDHKRRRFFGAAAMTIATAQFGLNSSAEAQPERRKTLDARGFKPGTNTSFASLKQIDAGLLNIGYAEAGPPMVNLSSSCTAGPTTSIVLSMSHRCSRPRVTV
jgi:hypothetical protein